MLTKRLKYVKSLSDHYRQRFEHEYLLELREKHIMGADPKRIPEVGEVVLIESKGKRNTWRLGKIIQPIQSVDNRIRAVILKTYDGSNTRYIHRPIEKLYPLEVRSHSSVSAKEIADAKNTIPESNQETTSKRILPSRVAADNGTLIRRLLMN